MNKRPLYVRTPPPDPFDSARTQERKVSADGTAEISLEDFIEVSQALPSFRQPSCEEIDLIEEPIHRSAVVVPKPAYRVMKQPLVSINATQEIALEDVLEARIAPIVDDEVDAFVAQGHAHDERSSEAPFAIDTSELRKMDRDRLTVLSTSEITRRKQRGALLVGAAVGVALAVLGVAGLSQALPMQGGARLTTTSNLRAAVPEYSKARAQRSLAPDTGGIETVSISVDALPKAVVAPKVWPKPAVKPAMKPSVKAATKPANRRH